MTWTDLGTPKPRREAVPYMPYDWVASNSRSLPSPYPFDETPLVATMLGRRTRRVFGTLSDVHLSKFLWLTSHSESAPDGRISLRTTPSAGAIHPIHVILSNFHEESWWRYVPSEHTLDEISLPPHGFDDLKSAMNEIVPFGEATALLLVAEPGKTASKYESSESLVWRDVGVLLGFQSIAAEGLGLSYCPLGMTGDPWIARLDPERKLVGVGAAFLGSRF